METLQDSRLFGSMADEKPLKVYRKTILAKQEVRILNPFNTQLMEVLLLSGSPDDPSNENAFVELWSNMEVAYFKRANKISLSSGFLIEETREIEREIPQTVDNFSDETVERLLKAKFFTLKKEVESMTSEAAVERVLRAAVAAERPEATLKFLRGRLLYLQTGEEEVND